MSLFLSNPLRIYSVDYKSGNIVLSPFPLHKQSHSRTAVQRGENLKNIYVEAVQKSNTCLLTLMISSINALSSCSWAGNNMFFKTEYVFLESDMFAIGKSNLVSKVTIFDFTAGYVSYLYLKSNSQSQAKKDPLCTHNNRIVQNEILK